MSKGGYEDFFKAARQASPSRASTGSTSRRGLNDYTESELRKIFKMEPSTKKAKKKSQYDASVFGLAGACICMAAMSLLFLFPEKVEELWSKIDITAMARATAKDEEKTSSQAKQDAAENSTSTKSSMPTEGGKSENWTAEDMSYFAKLNERKKELDLREQELSQLEEELHKQKTEIEARIRTLSEIRRDIAGVLQDRVSIDEGKVNKLVEFYSSMKPSQAAEIIATINEDLAVNVLGKMKKKDAAEIMNLLEPKKARTLSEKFAGYKRR